MAKVNTPPIAPPQKWMADPELSKNISDLYFVVYQLYQRSGGGDDYFTNIDADFDDINAQISAIILRIEALEAFIPSVYVLTADRVTNGAEVIIANGYNVTLNSSPADQERVTVKTNTIASTIHGNGKLIDGVTFLTTGSPYTSLELLYTVTTDSWSIV